MELIPGRVMVFGTFDVFHPGHKYFICQALKHSKDQDLVIVLARDKTVMRMKGQLRNPELLRLQILKKLFPELRVVLGDEKDSMAVLRKYCPEKVCLGYDQIGFSECLKREFPDIIIERLESFQPDKWKSSLMP